MLAYCDYIAEATRKSLYNDMRNNPESLIGDVMSVKMDLHPEGGYFLSTKKTINIFDKGGKEYRITVEEI
jgi:predicted cupin superfamily sugar epimerase